MNLFKYTKNQENKSQKAKVFRNLNPDSDRFQRCMNVFCY